MWDVEYFMLMVWSLLCMEAINAPLVTGARTNRDETCQEHWDDGDYIDDALEAAHISQLVLHKSRKKPYVS